MRQVPAPSMRIASMSSCGTCRNCSRKRNTAYGEPNRNGSTRPQNEPPRPTSLIMK